MAIVRKDGYYFDGVHYLDTDFVDGQSVTPIVNNLSNVTSGKVYTVETARRSASLYNNYRVNGSYIYVYEQKLTIKDDRGFRKEVRAKNFTAAKEAPVALALESNRPTVVVEIVETTEGGKVVINEIGTPVPMDSLSAARIYTANEISKAIRESNSYKQFRIYQEVAVARAKKPEIEFA